jgi:DNA-binding CsgD family transcriptional regulator
MGENLGEGNLGEKMSAIESLTPRQRQILRLIARHLQAKEVARMLKISERTVKTHTEEARKRLGVTSSREAARMLQAYEEAITPEALAPETPEAAEAEAIGLDDRGPSGPIDPIPGDVSVLGHEQDIYPPHTEPEHAQSGLLSGPLERAGDRPDDAGRTKQAGLRRRDTERSEGDQSGNGARQRDLLRHRRNGLADRRRDKLQRRLRALSVPQWLGMIVLVAFLSVISLGGLVTGAQGMLQAIENFKRHSG